MKKITEEWIKKAEEDYRVATQTMKFDPTPIFCNMFSCPAMY